MPLRPISALIGAPSGRHGALAFARAKRWSRAAGVFMSSAVTSTRRRAEASGCGQDCAKTAVDEIAIITANVAVRIVLPPVMRGLDPRIHPIREGMMDCRVKPGNDGEIQPSFASTSPGAKM